MIAINYAKTGIFFITSLVLAAVLSFVLPSRPLEEQLINIAVAENLPYLTSLIEEEPIENKAILLDYADNPERVLKTWLALKKYPQTGKAVLLQYGTTPEFQNALLTYGEAIIPVIDYFVQNDITSLTAQATLGNIWQNLKNNLSSSSENNAEKDLIAKLTPQQRGWYAIYYINQEGYNFLAQFAIDKQGQAHWIQTDRTTKAVVNFFTGGIRDLESKYKTDADINSEDILWASVDVLALASTVKLLRASKAASVGKNLSYSQKSVGFTRQISIFSFKLIKNKTVQRLLVYSALGAGVYVLISHPSLINSLLAALAQSFNLSPELMQVGGWFVLIFLLLFPFVWGFNMFIKPVIWLAKKIM